MSPNQELCKEELSLLRRESQDLLLKAPENDVVSTFASLHCHASNPKIYESADVSLLQRDLHSLDLENKNDGDDKLIENDSVKRLWQDIISSSTKVSPEPTGAKTTGTSSKIFQALSRIRILDDNSSKGNLQWLKSYSGQLESLPLDFIQTLKEFAPTFNARVADFNDNLFYDMQDQYGLNHLFQQPQIQKHKSPTIQTQNLDSVIQKTLQCDQFLGSFMSTESTIPQPAHVDFTWERLEESGQDLRIGFFPLTSDGMFLQCWQRNDDLEQRKIHGDLIFIPFGMVLTLPATTIHGGGFRSTPFNSRKSRNSKERMKEDHSHGNLRFHLYMANNNTRLSKNQTTNKYTEPFDRRKELADRYVNSAVMGDLIGSLFV